MASKSVEVCTHCHKEKPVKIRTPDGRPVCNNCYQRPKEKCVRCGEVKMVQKRVSEGAICYDCYQPPMEACVKCGRDKPVHRRSPDGPICLTCYRREWQRKKRKKKKNGC